MYKLYSWSYTYTRNKFFNLLFIVYLLSQKQTSFYMHQTAQLVEHLARDLRGLCLNPLFLPSCYNNIFIPNKLWNKVFFIQCTQKL